MCEAPSCGLGGSGVSFGGTPPCGSVWGPCSNDDSGNWVPRAVVIVDPAGLGSTWLSGVIGVWPDSVSPGVPEDPGVLESWGP